MNGLVSNTSTSDLGHMTSMSIYSNITRRHEGGGKKTRGDHMEQTGVFTGHQHTQVVACLCDCNPLLHSGCYPLSDEFPHKI